PIGPIVPAVTAITHAASTKVPSTLFPIILLPENGYHNVRGFNGALLWQWAYINTIVPNVPNTAHAKKPQSKKLVASACTLLQLFSPPYLKNKVEWTGYTRLDRFVKVI